MSGLFFTTLLATIAVAGVIGALLDRAVSRVVNQYFETSTLSDDNSVAGPSPAPPAPLRGAGLEGNQ